MAIMWGTTTEIEFDGPTPIEEWNPSRLAAIYAIMIKPDPKNKPNIFKIIYFGESENLSDRGFYKSHHKYPCWLGEAGSISNIFIGIHPMQNSTGEERKKIEQGLINDYKPSCND